MNTELDYEIKLQTANLCQAMLKNINDNFSNVSFEILANDDIQVKIILLQQTKIETELIDDLIAEFAALQKRDNVLPPIIITSNQETALSNLVYRLSDAIT